MTLLLALMLAPATLAAQESPYVPLDDAAYGYIDALQARGFLRSLSMLERPYTARAIRTALHADSAASAGRVVSSWRAALSRAVAKYDPLTGRCEPPCASPPAEELAVSASIGAFVTSRTSAMRELMTADDVDGTYPGAVGRFSAQGGPFVAAARVLADRRYRDDPEYVGKKDRSVVGRVEDAYLGVNLPYVQLTAGRVARNLGPAAAQGLQIGHYAYTYDHLFARLGTRRFHLNTMIAALDPMPVGDSVANRYLALHRLSGRWGGLEIAIAEAMLFGGVGRRFDPGYLNPLNIYQLSQYNERAQGNVSYSLEAAWQTGRFGTFAGQLLIDDFQIDDCELGCKEPSSYGLTLAADGLPLVGAQRWFASYARVSNLTYRTPTSYEAWTSFGVGLGHGRSDYDEARAGLDLALVPGLVLRPYGAYRRQGEGDYRLAFPPAAEYGTTPGIHAGVVERTMRVGAQGSWAPFATVEVRGDIGWNRSENAGHVDGVRESAFEGWVRVAIEAPWALRRGIAWDPE